MKIKCLITYSDCSTEIYEDGDGYHYKVGTDSNNNIVVEHCSYAGEYPDYSRTVKVISAQEWKDIDFYMIEGDEGD